MEQKECWDRFDIQCLSNCLVFVDVDFHKVEFTAVLPSQGFKDRSQLLARFAPVSVAIQDHWFFMVDDFSLEILH